MAFGLRNRFEIRQRVLDVADVLQDVGQDHHVVRPGIFRHIREGAGKGGYSADRRTLFGAGRRRVDAAQARKPQRGQGRQHLAVGAADIDDAGGLVGNPASDLRGHLAESRDVPVAVVRVRGRPGRVSRLLGVQLS